MAELIFLFDFKSNTEPLTTHESKALPVEKINLKLEF